MTNTNKFVLGVIGVIGLVMLVVSQLNKPATLGADVMTNPQWFYNGASFGKGNWFVGGNAGDSSFGVSLNQDGSSPSFSISSAGAVSLTTGSITTLVSGAFTQGGGIAAVSVATTTYTLSASDFDTENVIDITAASTSATVTLPASSTLSSFVPTAGQVRTIYIRNATTTLGIDLTIAAGAGMTLRSASTTAIIKGNTTGSSYGKIDFVRKSNSDINALISVYNN